jgi:NADH-quinone oxidoreductase subunit H
MYVTVYLHKKILAHMQSRRGPLHTGFHGILQTLSQTLKLLLKSPKNFFNSQNLIITVGAIISITFAIAAFLLIPLTGEIFFINVEISLPLCLCFIMISNTGAFLSINRTGLNTNKILGLLDRISTIILFSVPLFISSLGPVTFASSFNLFEIVRSQVRFYNIIYQPLSMIVFSVTCLLLWQRLSLDMPSKNTYLNIDYLSTQAGLNLLMFSISEYVNILSLSLLATLLFFGGWNGPGFLHPIIWTIIKTFILQVIFLFLYTVIPKIKSIRRKINISLVFLSSLSLLNLLIVIFVVLYLKPIFNL